MKSFFLSTLLLTLPVAAQDGAAAAPEGADASQASEFGAPVVVNGEQISDLEIKRFLIYGVGQTILETDRLAILIEEELKHRGRVLEGEYAAEMFPDKPVDDLSDAERTQVQARVDEILAQYELDEAYLKWVMDTEVAKFRERYPTLDLDTEIARAYGSPEWYDLQVKRTLEFDECFFKGDPDNWPDITKEAIWAGSPEVDLVQDMKESWDRRVQQAQEAGQPYPRREDEMFFGLLREYVISMLSSLIEQKTAVEGLPPELVLTMEGDGWSAEIRTEDVWERLAPFVVEQDIKIAKRWLAVMKATEDRLESEGYLVPLEDHYEHLAKTQEELESSMFSMEFLAVTGHGFPSTQCFRQYLRPFESYRAKLQDVLVPSENGNLSPILIDYLPIANKVLGISRANVEVMLIGAFDQPTFEWKENGWEWAEKESKRLRAEIDAHLDKLAAQEEAQEAAAANGEEFQADEELLPFDRYWASMLDLHSEFWDPPMPATGKMPAMQGLQNKGRFGNQPRNCRCASCARRVTSRGTRSSRPWR